jgi:hypothetical protein
MDDPARADTAHGKYQNKRLLVMETPSLIIVIIRLFRAPDIHVGKVPVLETQCREPFIFNRIVSPSYTN